MQIPSYLKKSIYSGLTFFSTVTLLSIGYATLVGGLSSADRVGTGSGLTSGAWNKIVNSILELDTRTQSISSSGSDLQVSGYNVSGFVGEWYQNANVSVSTAIWVDIPGASVSSFNLSSAKILNLRAFGSISAVGGSTPFTHCGFRFVLDNNPYGNASWGDQIIGCNSGGAVPQTGYWCPWNIERNIPVSAGIHNVKVQMTGWWAGYSACTSDTNSYSATRLFINAR